MLHNNFSWFPDFILRASVSAIGKRQTKQQSDFMMKHSRTFLDLDQGALQQFKMAGYDKDFS
jgi:hypothetical protein